MSAPATSANLGPGFDCAGLALTLRNELVVRPGSGAVTVEGEGAGTLACDGSNLVARAFEHAAPGALARHDLACTNRVPLARGLGSSTAAAATGLVAGWTVAGTAWDEARLFAELAAFDGHPDNAVACACGGVALAGPAGTRDGGDAGGQAVAIRLPHQPWLEPLVVVPHREVSTARAREALPREYARADVVRAIAGAATLGAGLALADGGLVGLALHADVVHEAPRAGLVPELGVVRAALAASGLEQVRATISGAGPSVLVWCPVGSRDAVRVTLERALPDVRLLVLDVDPAGARAER